MGRVLIGTYRRLVTATYERVLLIVWAKLALGGGGGGGGGTATARTPNQ